MATHYEVLGVDPDASHDEVKRAFLDAALRYHPDRLGTEADAAARERAEWRMREINEAWAVLQSPGGRARYDEELAAGIDKGPLHGIPFGLKDIYCTRGILTTADSKTLIDHVPS